MEAGGIGYQGGLTGSVEECRQPRDHHACRGAATLHREAASKDGEEAGEGCGSVGKEAGEDGEQVPNLLTQGFLTCGSRS